MPFTLKNIKQDLEDIGPGFGGPPGLEFRAAGGALELERSGLSYQRVPPDSRFPSGHPPGTWRGYEAEPDCLEILVIAAPSVSQRDDVEGERDWW